jgi:hypothetical protein
VDSSSALTTLTNAEFVFWLAVLGAALRSRLRESLPPIFYFIIIKLVTTSAYTVFTTYYVASGLGGSHTYTVWFVFYWISFFASTLAAFFSIEQIMARALSPLPGLAKLAVIVFRYTGVLTFFIAVTAHLPEARTVSWDALINALFYSLFLCMALFEITLVSLLAIFAHRLGLSPKTRLFGFSTGFCMLGMLDFLSVATADVGQKWMGLGLSSEIATDACLVMWVAYLLMPEQKRGALMFQRESSLLRWDQVVKQLGLGPQPVGEQIPSFMTDVEAVVERIMLRRQGSSYHHGS